MNATARDSDASPGGSDVVDGMYRCSVETEPMDADGTLRIVSAHRLLDESLAVTVEAVRDQGVGMDYLLDVRHGIALSELGGSLTPTDFLDEPGVALTGLELSGSFRDGAFVGLLSAYAVKHTRQHSEGFLFDILASSTEPVE